MRHLDKCIEAVQFENVQNEIMLHNLKRKMEEDPTEVIEDVKRQYNVHYPTKIKRLSIRSDSQRIYLFDDDYQQPRFVYPLVGSMKPLLIPPVGCKRVILYDFSITGAAPKTLPKLTADALKSIFKHINGWELLPMRLVCRQWNRILKSTHSLWTIRVSRTPDKWIGLSPFHTYLKHMFLNISHPQILYNFFLKQPRFFAYICGLLIGQSDIGPIVTSGRDEIIVKGYRLNRKTGLTYNGRPMDIEYFVEAYRQSIL